jgi:hypothetical protein
MLVAHGIGGLLEGAALYAGKKIGKLFSAGHGWRCASSLDAG